MLADIIISGYKRSAPPELIEHYYKKEYGLTTEEFYKEPADRISWFLKIKEFESIKQEREAKSGELRAKSGINSR